MPVVRIEVSGENERGIRRKNGKNEVTGDLKKNPTPSPPPLSSAETGTTATAKLSVKTPKLTTEKE